MMHEQMTEMKATLEKKIVNISMKMTNDNQLNNQQMRQKNSPFEGGSGRKDSGYFFGKGSNNERGTL